MPRGLGVPESLGGKNSVVGCEPRNKKYFYIKYSIKLSCHVNTVILGKDVRPGHPKMATGQSLLREPETRAAASAPPLCSGVWSGGPGSSRERLRPRAVPAQTRGAGAALHLPQGSGPHRPLPGPPRGGTPWTPRGRAALEPVARLGPELTGSWSPRRGAPLARGGPGAGPGRRGLRRPPLALQVREGGVAALAAARRVAQGSRARARL